MSSHIFRSKHVIQGSKIDRALKWTRIYCLPGLDRGIFALSLCCGFGRLEMLVSYTPLSEMGNCAACALFSTGSLPYKPARAPTSSYASSERVTC